MERSPLQSLCSRLDALLCADPVGRGTSRLRAARGRGGSSELLSAATSLAEARGVGIVTGFCIVDAERPMAETDGPPGSLYLAWLLNELGCEARLLSDAYGASVLEAGCDVLRLERSTVVCMPFADGAFVDAGHDAADDAWVSDFLQSPFGRRLTHLVAIERPGPSHTLESIGAESADAQVIDAFQQEVPPEHRGVCHNMRGAVIESHTAGLHRLFEIAAQTAARRHTIGIGDGGNEIGFGAIAWKALRDAIGGPHAGRIASRVATDDLLIAGTSDWAAYALAAALAHAAGRASLVSSAHVARQGKLIETLIRQSPVVDGVTRRREASVDGLALDKYLAFFAQVTAVASG